jgi:hypothetical protein
VLGKCIGVSVINFATQAAPIGGVLPILLASIYPFLVAISAIVGVAVATEFDAGMVTFTGVIMVTHR